MTWKPSEKIQQGKVGRGLFLMVQKERESKTADQVAECSLSSLGWRRRQKFYKRVRLLS